MAKKIKCGISIANFGITKDPQDYVNLAIIAEENGWDGFFLWDHIYLSSDDKQPFLDPWITLTAIACNTITMKLGTMVTPLPRRRPWKVAKEIITLDHLSKGRVILGVGLGVDPDFNEFGENSDPIIRGQKLDESLEIIKGLWSSESFSYQGKHFKIKEMQLYPKPFQDKIPIWIAGTWSNKKPFRRAARYDGVFPLRVGFEEPLYPNDYEDILNYMKQFRKSFDSYDVVKTIVTTGIEKEDEWIFDFLDIGVTWFLESIWPERDSLENIKKIIARGPPSL